MLSRPGRVRSSGERVPTSNVAIRHGLVDEPVSNLRAIAWVGCRMPVPAERAASICTMPTSNFVATCNPVWLFI